MDIVTQEHIINLFKVTEDVDKVHFWMNKIKKIKVDKRLIKKIKKVCDAKEMAEHMLDPEDEEDVVYYKETKETNKIFVSKIFGEAIRNNILLTGFTPDQQNSLYLRM